MYQFKYLFVLFICWVIALLCVPFQVFLYFCMWCVITSVICDICQRHIFLNSPQCIWHVRLVFFQINQFSSLQIAILLILKNIHHLLCWGLLLALWKVRWQLYCRINNDTWPVKYCTGPHTCCRTDRVTGLVNISRAPARGWITAHPNMARVHPHQ